MRAVRTVPDRMTPLRVQAVERWYLTIWAAVAVTGAGWLVARVLVLTATRGSLKNS